MKQISLSRGRIALVDDQDYDALSKWKWSFVPVDVKHPDKGYACRTEYPDGSYGRRKTVLMHRQIMGAGPGQQIDHRHGDGLNNQRHNLRFCINSQNSHNSDRPKSGKSSRYRGVSFWKSSGKWNAEIYAHRRRVYLGAFQSELEAAVAYNLAAVELMGEFARPNEVV